MNCFNTSIPVPKQQHESIPLPVQPTGQNLQRFASGRTAGARAMGLVLCAHTHTHTFSVLSCPSGHNQPSFSQAQYLVLIARQADSSDSIAYIYNNQRLYLGQFLITVSALKIKPRHSYHILPYPSLPLCQLLPDILWFHLKFSTSGRFS